jgi:DNA-binding transcriptional LysR family regulator
MSVSRIYCDDYEEKQTPVGAIETRLTIEQLRSFVAVAEELNFTRASRRLFIASSPLSRRIKALEEAVGVALFERGTRHVRLTSAGEQMLPLAREIIDRVRALAPTVQSHAAQSAECIRIGIPHGVHMSDRARVFEELRRAAPGHEFAVDAGMTTTLANRLVDRSLDLSFLHGTVDLSRFETLVIRDEPFGVMLPAAHPLAAHELVDASDLAGMTLVLVDTEPLPPQQLEICRFFEAVGAVPRLLRDVQAVSTVVGSSSSSFSILPVGEGSPCPGFFAAPDVVMRPLDGLDLTFTTAVAWLPERVAFGESELAAVVDGLRQRFFGVEYSVAGVAA